MRRLLIAASVVVISGVLVAGCSVPPDPTTRVPGAVQFRDAGGAQDAGWTLVDTSPVDTSPYPARERPGLLNGSWVILDPGWQPCRDSDGSYTECVEIGPGPPFVLTEVLPSGDPTEVLWTSTNGVNWTPEVIAAFEGKAVERGSMDRVPVQGGLLWALVSPLGEADDEWWSADNTEVWVTEDGTAWNQVQWLDSPEPNSRPSDVTFIDASRSGDAIFLTQGTWPGPWASSDAGRTFAPVEPFTDQSAHVAAHWVSAGEFRAIVRTTGTESGLTLWRSADAITWNRMGTIEGLDAAAGTWGTLKGSFSEEALVVQPSDRCGVALVRSLDGGLTWQPLDGVSEFLSDRAGPIYEHTFNEDCHLPTGAMHGWIVVQAGFSEVGVSRDGLDWYFIDGRQLGSPRFPSIYTDEGWAMPPPD